MQLPFVNGFFPGVGLYPVQQRPFIFGLGLDFGFMRGLGLDLGFFTLGIYKEEHVIYTSQNLVVYFMGLPFSVHSLFFFL